MINKIKAYSVHLLTGSGILMSFFSIISIINENKLLTFTFLLIALFIDVIDGYLARKYNVKKYSPNIDGRMLDSIVDYVNFVFIPCVIIYKFSYLPEQFCLILPIIILGISLFSFSYQKIIDDRHLYLGFPSIWNVIIIYLTILNLNIWLNLFILVFLIFLKVIPLKVMHPMRYEKHKKKNSIFALSLIFISFVLLLARFNINLFNQFLFIFEIVWYGLNLYFIILVLFINLNSRDA